MYGKKMAKEDLKRRLSKPVLIKKTRPSAVKSVKPMVKVNKMKSKKGM